ncbi:hypothetical protein [Gryllotalpicola kribbensis]
MITPGVHISAGAKLPDGFVAYPMADGSKVAVSESAPVPAAVIADAGKQAGAIVKVSGSTVESQEAVVSAADSRASLINVQTGHAVVLIYRGLAVTGTGANMSYIQAWVMRGAVSEFPTLVAGNLHGWGSAEAAQAAATAAVGANTSVVVVVAQ